MILEARYNTQSYYANVDFCATMIYFFKPAGNTGPVGFIVNQTLPVVRNCVAVILPVLPGKVLEAFSGMLKICSSS